MELEIKRFDEPDESRTFEKGRLDLVRAGGVTFGRATYEPGWKWSVHVAPLAGTASCEVEHVVLVLAGRIAIAMDDGRLVEAGPGSLCAVPRGHDSWVVGEEPYVSLHLIGAEAYAK